LATIVRIDSEGKIFIPRHFRELIDVKEGGFVKVKVENRRIVVEPIWTTADRFYGAFKVEEWPNNLDEFMVEAARKWHTKRST